MMDEVSDTIDELKNGKAYGGDRMPNEFLKVGKRTLSKSLQHIFSKVASMERVLRWWIGYICYSREEIKDF